MSAHLRRSRCPQHGRAKLVGPGGARRHAGGGPGKLGAAMAKVVQSPKVQSRLNSVGVNLPSDTSAAALKTLLTADFARWQDSGQARQHHVRIRTRRHERMAGRRRGRCRVDD